MRALSAAIRDPCAVALEWAARANTSGAAQKRASTTSTQIQSSILIVLHVHDAADRLNRSLDLRSDREIAAERNINLAATLQLQDQLNRSTTSVLQALSDRIEG